MSDTRNTTPPYERFRVTLERLDGSRFPYDVCTCFGEHKAVALAATVHAKQHLDLRDGVYRVVAVDRLPGSGPLSADLVDRNEW